MKTMGAMTALWLLAALCSVQAADHLQAFPPAEEGMVRYVLQLPQQEDESAFKVELIVGKTVPVDTKAVATSSAARSRKQRLRAGDFHATGSAHWGRWRARGWRSIRTRRR